MDLTVAICTYRRLDMLSLTLDSLTRCTPINAAWELVLIDNAGEQAVANLAQSFADRLPLRYLHEPNLGASHARNRATREAKAPIILFTDDDVLFDVDWLSRMWQAVGSQPDCAFWGGRVEPIWPAQKPAWYDDELSPMMGDAIVQYRRGAEPRSWQPENDPPFYTANLALRVASIEQAGYFDTNVGHVGGKRMGMEDSLMVKAISNAGGPGWYAADAVVHHPVPPDRMTKSYMFGFARRQAWLSAQLHRGSRRLPPPWFFRAAGERTLKAIGRMIAGSLTFRSDQAPAKRFAGIFDSWFGLWQILWGLIPKRDLRR